MALLIDAGWHPLVHGAAPEWASAWGEDRYGVWAAFRVKGVTQKLRWIPPGRSLMGSPEGEFGRYEDEGPRHEVVLVDGFWLFDAPCTQALWQAVTGGHSSRFQTQDDPVEGVSFEDVAMFIKKLNSLVKGLDLSLPSEAWWEYACRAGIVTATYAGDLPEDEDGQRAVLDAITWWYGNSDSKIHPVRTRRPNAWGLYDMLGNVWEWCADNWHNHYEGAPSDGSAWISEGTAGRVIRGGSWHSDVQYMRAACRHGDGPSYRSDGIGFRCAQVSVSEAWRG